MVQKPPKHMLSFKFQTHTHSHMTPLHPLCVFRSWVKTLCTTGWWTRRCDRCCLPLSAPAQTEHAFTLKWARWIWLQHHSLNKTGSAVCPISGCVPQSGYGAAFKVLPGARCCWCWAAGCWGSVVYRGSQLWPLHPADSETQMDLHLQLGSTTGGGNKDGSTLIYNKLFMLLNLHLYIV